MLRHHHHPHQAPTPEAPAEAPTPQIDEELVNKFGELRFEMDMSSDEFRLHVWRLLKQRAEDKKKGNAARKVARAKNGCLRKNSAYHSYQSRGVRGPAGVGVKERVEQKLLSHLGFFGLGSRNTFASGLLIRRSMPSDVSSP